MVLLSVVVVVGVEVVVVVVVVVLVPSTTTFHPHTLSGVKWFVSSSKSIAVKIGIESV